MAEHRWHYDHSLYSSKDVRLPLQLQRAMAAEVEAAREAQAKVSLILCCRVLTWCCRSLLQRGSRRQVLH